MAYNDRTATILFGTFTFLIPFLFFKIFISALLKIIIYYTGNIHAINIYKIITKDLYFNHFKSIAIEGLFSCIIISYLNLKTIEYTSIGETSGAALSFYCISSSICLPLLLAYILFFKKYDEIIKLEFMERWGSLFKFIKLKQISSRYYYLIFLVRRYVYIGIFLLY